MANTEKKSVLVIGGGAVGAIGALNLEVGGLAKVTVVLRSNFTTVKENGYQIDSCDHGTVKNFKPFHVRNEVPDIAKENLPPYDYIVLATKNIPDVPPTVSQLISPALSKNNTHTTVVLIQNGLNIEKPLIETYPSTPILSGVSLIGSVESAPGVIVQEDRDRLLVGAFPHPTLPHSQTSDVAKNFVNIYGKGGKTQVEYSQDVLHDRWRKLVYNACLNPICAITGLDTGRIRLADGGIEGLVRPAMTEIVSAAKANNVTLAPDVVDFMIEVDPLDLYLSPSMLADVSKSNFIEYENLLGEPLREGKKAGVSMPTLEVLYQLARAIQWRTKENKGYVGIPPKRKPGA